MSSLPVGAASGIGSLPGTDIAEALRTVFGELPDLPYLPELPARGPGADLIGRSAGLLVGLPVELYAARWQVAAHPGRDARRTADLLERDLDGLTEHADGYTGPVKISCAGPWTLAAGLHLPIGGALLRDPGAVRDLTDSLAEGLAAHVAEVRRRVPGAEVLLQLDEPSLPTVLAGRVPTESGLGSLRAVEETDARQGLATVIEAVGVPVVVHCCADAAPVALLRSAGAAAVALDLIRPGSGGPGSSGPAAGASAARGSGAPGRVAFDRVAFDRVAFDRVALDALGEAIESGMGLFAGAVPTLGAPPEAVRVAQTVRRLWLDLGFPLAELPDRVVVTPTCGLAGASWPAARAIMTACREAAARLLDEARS